MYSNPNYDNRLVQLCLGVEIACSDYYANLLSPGVLEALKVLIVSALAQDKEGKP